MAGIVDRVPILLTVILAVTLGLAPFFPEPHVVEKLRMLVSGQLVRGVDWFDLALHGSTWVLLFLTLWRETVRERRPGA